MSSLSWLTLSRHWPYPGQGVDTPQGRYSVDESLCETMEGLHMQLISSYQGDPHDTASSTHGRGYAGAQSFDEHPENLHRTSLAVCASFRSIARMLGRGGYPRLPGLSDEREEVSTRITVHNRSLCIMAGCGLPLP